MQVVIWLSEKNRYVNRSKQTTGSWDNYIKVSKQFLTIDFVPRSLIYWACIIIGNNPNLSLVFDHHQWNPI